MSGENEDKKVSQTVAELLENIKNGVGNAYGNGYRDCATTVDVALDAIIDIQNTFIPPPTFTVTDRTTTHTFEFEEGMTWGEWINSKYCTVPDDWTLVSFDAVCYKSCFVCTDNGYQDIVYASCDIESGHEYFAY